MNTFTSFDELEIAFDDHAPTGEALDLGPVILHHGFAASALLNWDAPGVTKALTDSGRRVVAIDARGHGRSGKPHDPSYYGESKMARDVSTLIDTLGVESVDLVGYSMGAIVSLLVGSHERRIRRLVIGGIGAGVVERGGVDTRALHPTALADAMRTKDPSTITDSGARQFRHFAESTGADLLALAAQVSAIHRERIALEDITAPALVLAGRDDALATRPEVLAGAIPGAELRVIDGDHLGAVAVPAFASAIVEFVNRS